MRPNTIQKSIWQRGVAAVELGLLLIPLTTLAFGITEYARAIYTYDTLTKTVRDAARYLTSKTPGDTAAHTAAKCLVVYGTDDCTGNPLALGLTIGMVQTCDAVATCAGVTAAVATGSGSINTVLVRVNGYPYTSVVTFVMPNITFNNISVTMRSQL